MGQKNWGRGVFFRRLIVRRKFFHILHDFLKWSMKTLLHFFFFAAAICEGCRHVHYKRREGSQRPDKVETVSTI